MNSLPVAFGIDTAKWICVASIDVTQLGVAAYLWAIGETWYAAVLAGLVLPQMFSQISFLQDPVNNDVKYQAAAQLLPRLRHPHHRPRRRPPHVLRRAGHAQYKT